MNKPRTMLATALVLSGCATLPRPPDNQWVGLRESARAGPVIVRPDRVIEDSRCPMNARCVWAGRVRIAATVWMEGKRRMVELQSDAPLPLAVGQLEIDAIHPDSFMTDKRPEHGDYSFHFRFRQNN